MSKPVRSPRRRGQRRDAARTRETRLNSTQRGYGYRWQKASQGFLAKHPLCRECERQGKITPASCVDHIVPHKGDQRLFWDSENNWQPLCDHCHALKTARGE